MDLSNLPPNHGGPLGDVWFRGLAKPEHLLAALKQDFYIMVVGCMMKYIRLEKSPDGSSFKPKVVNAFHHGVDGVSAIAGSQFRDVYALAERRQKPRIFIFQINKTERGELEPSYMHSLRRIHSWDIRSLTFVAKELLVVLTGYPTFNVVLFRWSTNEELMTSQPTEPSIFSRLLVSPTNPCRWMEYGEDYLYVYEMQSLTRTDVVRTRINLPKRKATYDHPDPFMGRVSATKIVSACWTLREEFFILDKEMGIHLYLPASKILQWTCTLAPTLPGMAVDQIVPYGDGVAAITGEGWFLNYGEIKSGGELKVHTAHKLSSKVLRYMHFPETPDTFYAVTESKGVVEGVSRGMLREPFAVADLMFTNPLACCFIEPQGDYIALASKYGKVVILESETGLPIAKWRLPFKVVGLASHPILPFLFCGTTYGCVNILDIRDLKSPTLISRKYFSKEPNSSITRFGFVSQGRYVISADTVNNRIFVQYGYPFMSFDYLDTARVPARISYIAVPGCGKDDNKFQVQMSGKSLSDQGIVAYIINFSLVNDRLVVTASQTVDQPVTSLCFSAMRKHQYGYFPLKNGLGVVPYCDDNQWLNLQEPEHYVECGRTFKHDISFMLFHGTKVYTFSEDGVIQVHEAPVIPTKKTQLPMVLRTLAKAQTHSFSFHGVKEGIVSFDGSQVLALGHDGTFCRVRFFPKPSEPDWKTLGYERTKLADYQIGTFLIDQEIAKTQEEESEKVTSSSGTDSLSQEQDQPTEVSVKKVEKTAGLGEAGGLGVDYRVRKQELTEPELFAHFEKTLMYKQHAPKADGLRQEFSEFTELMKRLMSFNQQREEGNQVSFQEFNFDDDREPRLKEKSEKLKKIAHIQMTVRNKFRHNKINALKRLLWEQFDTKGMTLLGFRKKLEVCNYPLLPEAEFYSDSVKEAISWRRLELRLEAEEEPAIASANTHALRVLQAEMQFMTPARRRLYIKSIMAIDPTAKFDDYEASDSDQFEESLSKVFEELGLQLPDEPPPDQAKSDLQTRSKAGKVADLMMTASKGANKWLQKVKKKQEEEMAYVERLKRMLLDDDLTDPTDGFKPIPIESLVTQSDVGDPAQSRREFMLHLKSSRPYPHPTGVMGPKSPDEHHAHGKRAHGKEVEVLMKPHAGDKDAKQKDISEAPSMTDMQVIYDGGLGPTPSKKKMKQVVRQRKIKKFKRAPDVEIEDEADVSGPEDEAVKRIVKANYESMDVEYKERFDAINSLFYGSGWSELTDMYRFQPAEFRYSQFELGSRHELWRHHYIIMSEIYILKKFFNRQFEMLRNTKAYSLKKMADRNDRIREIYYYLKMDLDIIDEKWGIQEDPSQIFTVTKEEIPVERYLTAEQKRIEEQRRLEELARQRTRIAEFRKKALIQMMDNRLEVRKEEILVNDIPKPPFMLEKDPSEYTMEEYLMSLQYLESVEALEKARVDMTKELEEELARLYRANAMEINTIDLRITELSLMKYQFHQNYQMEESRILRAIRQLRIMEDLDKEQKRIMKLVGELKFAMKASHHMAAELENKRLQCEEEIAKVADNEKDLERSFRKDLGDAGTHFQFFFNTYKKRPKLSLKGLNKEEVYETMVRALRSDNIRTFARENGETGRIVVMAIYDLEDPLVKPKDCPRSLWDKFNRVRRERLICNYQTKTLMCEIDRINEAINECAKKGEAGTQSIAAALSVVSHKNDLKNYFVSNVEFQMVLGKGHCEINCWSFKDHMNANVIMIDSVEKLNQRIYDASEKLIKEMTRTAMVHRDIKEIEWRFLVVEMATKDLRKVRHDVGSFKPTKRLLEVLRKGINLDTMHTDRIILVDYLRTTYIKYQEIFLKNKKKQLDIYHILKDRRHELNDSFKGEIFEEMESLVATQTIKVNANQDVDAKSRAEKKAAQLLFRGFLNRKLIRLSNEIDQMEAELERQYQKTYPIL